MRYTLLILVVVLLAYSCVQKKQRTEETTRSENENGTIIYSDGTSEYSDEYKKASQLVSDGKINEALLIYHGLASKEPDPSIPYSCLGAAHYTDKSYDSAVYYYKKAIGINPKDMAALVGIGSTYYSMGDDSAATYYYKQAISVDRNNPDPYCGLATLYMAIGDTENAKRCAAQYIKLAPESAYRPNMEEILNQ